MKVTALATVAWGCAAESAAQRSMSLGR